MTSDPDSLPMLLANCTFAFNIHTIHKKKKKQTNKHTNIQFLVLNVIQVLIMVNTKDDMQSNIDYSGLPNSG